jgi:hypothetical protein
MNQIIMKFGKRCTTTIVLVAFMQLCVFSACKQKAAAAKSVAEVSAKSKKPAACCKSGIPPRFGMPGVQPEKALANK